MRVRHFLLIAILGVACTDEATEPANTELPELPEGTVRVSVVANPQSDGTTLAEVWVEAQSLELGAYQGRLTFETETLEYLEASLPEDEYRFVSAQGSTKGEVLFAGFTVSEFETPVALRVRFRNKRDLSTADISAGLEVVGDVLGAEVTRERIQEPLTLIAR